MPDRPRVIIALPDPAECGTVADWLSADGFEPVRRPTSRAAADEMQTQAFDLLIADAAFAFREGLHTRDRARNSLTPTVVIGDSAAAPSEAASGQTMYMTRPIERALLVCFVSMAILDARPNRRSVRKAVNRSDAFVNGLATRIVDVSNEGLRLEVSPNRRSVLPPYFSVRVSLLDVAVTVQRIWMRPSSNGASTSWVGGALSQNRASAEQAWRSFVDTIPIVGASGAQMRS